MVIGRNFAAWGLATIATCSVAAPECMAPADERGPGLCPANLPPITRIVITKNAQKQPGEALEDCSDFVLTERTVRRYFTSAMRLGMVEHETKSSPCYAVGTLTFKNGQTAEWILSRERRGSFSLPGSQNPTELYCIDCMKDDPGPMR